MAGNSPDDVVEIVSSDDDFEEPRRRIGWNYQGKAINNAIDKMPSKINGKSIKGEKLSDSDSDDLEVLEVNPAPKVKSNHPAQKVKSNHPAQKVKSNQPTPKVKSNQPAPKIKSAKPKLNGNKLPASSTRKEIKVLSRAPQSTISQFFSPPKLKQSQDNISKSKINNKEKKYASDKYVSNKEDEEDSIGNKKDGKQDKPIIKWKKVTETRDTAMPSDKSEDSESEESDDAQENLDESHGTIEISSQDETLEDKLAKSKEKESKEQSENSKKDKPKGRRIQTIKLEGSIKKDDSSDEKEMLPPPVTSEESKKAVEKFIFHWKKVKSSKDDKKIEDKIWRNYDASHTSYTYSRKFLKQLIAFNAKMTEDNIYMVIKDLLDNLKCYKDKEYIEKKPKKSKDDSKEEDLSDLSPEERKRRRKLRKIEEKLKEISDKIREAEDMEVDLEDDDNSSYLIEDRLKRQFSKLDEYYCKLANCSTSTGRPTERKFKYEGSRYTEINKRISAWVNKHKEFPDYCDILNLVKKVTKDSLLPLRPETVRVQAQEIFRDVGKMLKDRRESDDLEIFYSRVDDEPEDPGHKDEELNKILEENGEVAKEKIEKVFQDYVDKEAEWRENQDQEASKKKNSLKKEKNKIDNDGAEDINNENAEESDDGQEDDNDDEDDEDDDDEGDDSSLPDISTGSNKDGEEDDIDSIIGNITGSNNDGKVNTSINEKKEEAEDQGDISEEDVPILDSEEMDALALGTNSGSIKRPLESDEESGEKKKCREEIST